MKITGINKQKSNTERYNIFIDNIFRFSGSDEDVIKNRLVVDTIVDESEIERLIEKCEFSKAYKYSLYLMGRKDYTSFEMESKLKNKEYSNITIKITIEKLKDLGFINDTKFSEKYLHDSLYIKKQGIQKIKYELGRKGITKDEIEGIEIDENIEYQNALDLAQKKYKLIVGKDNVRDKLFRFLIGKGYDFELIKKVIYEVIKNEEESFDN